MIVTDKIKLPLVAAAQAQKHVTVNEAFQRIDALMQLSVVSRSQSSPPAVPILGQNYIVPSNGAGLWLGKGGQLAIAANGGWDYVVPQTGWRSYIEDEGNEQIYNGTDWVGTVLRQSPSGAATRFEITEFDHIITAGNTNITSVHIPAGAMLIAVSARVLTSLGGGVGSWQMGISSNPTQFGDGLGAAQGSFAEGILSAPTTYYSPTPILLSPVSGVFTTGSVRIAIHHLKFDLPGL